MNTIRRQALAAVVLTTLAVSGCATTEDVAQPADTVTSRTTTAPAEIVTYASTYESADLLARLIEEEKVAHDLYLAFEEQYGARVFSNIKRSEVTHQDHVLAVMEATGVEDPRLPEPGQFRDAELQDLYDDLLAQGSVNLPAAYQAGVDFETQDIAGLETELEKAPESDTALTTLLQMLFDGSRNHLTAFQRQLSR